VDVQCAVVAAAGSGLRRARYALRLLRSAPATPCACKAPRPRCAPS